MQLYVGSVQYVVSLLFASLCHFLITRPMLFNILFCLFLVLYVCVLFCVFCAFVLFCVLFLLLHKAISFLFLCKFTDHWHRVEIQLQ